MTAEGGSAVRTSLARERTILNPLGRGVAVYTTDDILPRDCFVHMIRTERKRVERSKSPFSLAVFSGGRPGIDRLGRMGRLIQIIYELKRDTDVVGYLQDNSVESFSSTRRTKAREHSPTGFSPAAAPKSPAETWFPFPTRCWTGFWRSRKPPCAAVR